MNIVPILFAIRLAAAALVACAFLTVPMADAQHVDYEPAVACGVDQSLAHDGEGESDHDDHEHHAHNCGSCHIHILRRDIGPHPFAPTSANAIRPPLAENLTSLPPGNLYRPPRA